MSYTPIPGSLAERVCSYFRKFPDEELSRHDIALKFDCNLSSIQSQLATAVAEQILTVRKDRSGSNLYGAGGLVNQVQTTEEATAAMAASVHPKRRRTTLPLLDMSSISIQSGVPMPSRTASMKGQTRYEALFESLKNVGDCALVPRAYGPTLSKAASVHGKRVNRSFKVRVYDDTQIGIWRVA